MSLITDLPSTEALPLTPGGFPCLILNADYQPLSYYPLSVWSWQDAVKAVFLDRVQVVDNYDRSVCSASFEMPIPSVVALKDYITQNRSPAQAIFLIPSLTKDGAHWKALPFHSGVNRNLFWDETRTFDTDMH